MSGYKIPVGQKAKAEASDIGLSIRSAPSFNAPSKGTIPDGAVLAVLKRFGSWFIIRYNETEGFVFGDEITLLAN